MEHYQAITALGTFEIGEFSSQQEAESWAKSRYGDQYQGVARIPSIVVQTSAYDPFWIIVIAAIAFIIYKKT
jgi:hypothetical protein